jgi:hypothetical protein
MTGIDPRTGTRTDTDASAVDPQAPRDAGATRRVAPIDAVAERRAALIEDVTWMAETGETFVGAARRLGMRPRSLKRTLLRAGHGALIRRLNANTAAGTGLRRGRIGGAA